MTGSGGWLKQFPGGFITSYRTSAWSMSTDLEAPCVPKTPQHVPIFFFHIISENSPEAWETANSAIQNLKPQKMVGIYSLKIASFHRTWSKIQPKFRQIRPKPQGFRHPKGIPRGFPSKAVPFKLRRMGIAVAVAVVAVVSLLRQVPTTERTGLGGFQPGPRWDRLRWDYYLSIIYVILLSIC